VFYAEPMPTADKKARLDEVSALLPLH